MKVCWSLGLDISISHYFFFFGHFIFPTFLLFSFCKYKEIHHLTPDFFYMDMLAREGSSLVDHSIFQVAENAVHSQQRKRLAGRVSFTLIEAGVLFQSSSQLPSENLR